MLSQAMDKLRDEMAREAAHHGVQIIGAYLTDRLSREPEIAQKLLDNDKTLKGAFDAIYSYASQHKTNNYAFVPPEQAYELVAKYYGLTAENPEQAEKHPQALAEKQAQVEDALNLDDLLGM